MPKIVQPRTITVELTQEEVNHITVALGNTHTDEVRRNADNMEVSDNTTMYKFFKELAKEGKL